MEQIRELFGSLKLDQLDDDSLNLLLEDYQKIVDQIESRKVKEEEIQFIESFKDYVFVEYQNRRPELNKYLLFLIDQVKDLKIIKDTENNYDYQNTVKKLFFTLNLYSTDNQKLTIKIEDFNAWTGNANWGDISIKIDQLLEYNDQKKGQFKLSPLISEYVISTIKHQMGDQVSLDQAEFIFLSFLNNLVYLFTEKDHCFSEEINK